MAKSRDLAKERYWRGIVRCFETSGPGARAMGGTGKRGDPGALGPSRSFGSVLPATSRQ